MMNPLIAEQSLTDLCIYFFLVVCFLSLTVLMVSTDVVYLDLQEDTVFACAFTNVELSRFVH